MYFAQNVICQKLKRKAKDECSNQQLFLNVENKVSSLYIKQLQRFDLTWFVLTAPSLTASLARTGTSWTLTSDDNSSHHGYFSNTDGCYMFQCYLWGMFNFIGKPSSKCSTVISRLSFYILLVFYREAESQRSKTLQVRVQSGQSHYRYSMLY